MNQLAKKILEKISDGETGGTFSIRGRLQIATSGYFVATNGIEFNQIPSEDVLQNEVYRIFRLYPEPYIGFWLNDGKLYLDAVRWVSKEKEAIRLGKKKNQISIWDCKNQTEIFLNK